MYIIRENIMNLQVAKWGNSLALRIPAEYVRSIGIKEGDSVEACLTVDGGLTIRPATWNRKAFSRNLAAAREAMPMGKSVMDEVRRGGRY
jgi:antitoxin MazE